MRITDFINSYTEESEKKGLYYYVNKRKKAGTSRSKNNPKAPSAQDWKNAAKTAKKESIGESVIPWDGKAVVVYDATGANLLDTLDINVAAQKYGLNSNDIRNQLKIQQYTKLKGPKGEFMVSHPMAPTALDAEPGFATESDNDHDLFSNRRRRPQDEPTSPVASSIIRRIMLQRPDLLSHGPEAVGNAVDEVAEWVGDVEEIGSSDVSGWVRQVERILQGNQGVAEGSLNEFAPDGFNGGDDGEEFNPRMAKMAYDEGVVKGASLADGATTQRAMAINDWDKHDGGIYKQHFAKGFKAGRMDKIRHNNKQYNLNLQLMKDGSIRHGEQGVAEDSSDGMSYRAAYVAGEIEHARQTGQTYQFEPEEDNPQFKSLVTKYLQQYGQHDFTGFDEAVNHKQQAAIALAKKNKFDEAAIKPEQLSQLQKLKRDLSQQAQQAITAPLSPEKQADLDAWERDFAATHGSRTFAQDKSIDAKVDELLAKFDDIIGGEEDWRTRSRDTRKKLRAQRIKADQLISMGEKMLALIDRSEKFPGGIPPGLRSDLENLEAAFDEQNPDYDTLIDLYTKRLGQLQDFVNMKRAVYRKPKTPRYNEGVMEAIPLDKLRSTGTRVKDEVSAKLKQNGPLGRDAEKAKQNGKPVEQGVAEEHDDEFAHSDRAANEIAAGRWRRGGELTGTSLKGYIETTYEQLESVFGEPMYGPNDTDGDKITCEWLITFQDGTVATIYDWKVDETPFDLYSWHIGGNNNKAKDYVSTLMRGKGDVKTSMWEGRTGLYVDGTLKRVFESRAIADKLFSNALSWFPDQTVELKSMTEDATGGSSCSSSIGAVVTELGGGMSKRQLNTKLSKYTNIARKPKQVRVKGGY